MDKTEAAFTPARSIPEASARMFALTTAPDAGTRGPKRSLVALAQSLGLDVDLEAVNAGLGGQIAAALGADWHAGHDYRSLQVTLDGMNTLLLAASENLVRLSHAARVSSRSVAEVLLAFPGFKPARGKQEAVNRMCDLAGVPHDTLGPGGKEHAWTLRDLAARLAPHLLERKRTKHQLAEALCEDFGVPWLDSAGSTGASITLEGLNLILAGAERRAHVSSAAWASASEEGTALVAALASGLPSGMWVGKTCVERMYDAGSRNWFQSEWPGWFYEEQARTVLNTAYPMPPVGGPRVRYGSTNFDYASPSRVWDTKAHTAWTLDYPLFRGQPKRASRATWLNDARAMRECVGEQGLGFLIADGVAGLDVDGEFRSWLNEFGAARGKKPSGYIASTGRSRSRKAAWSPTRLRAIWIEDAVELDAGIAAGWLQEKPQPAWGAGEGRRERNDKFQGTLDKAGPWTVASHEWPAEEAGRPPGAFRLP